MLSFLFMVMLYQVQSLTVEKAEHLSSTTSRLERLEKNLAEMKYLKQEVAELRQEISFLKKNPPGYVFVQPGSNSTHHKKHSKYNHKDCSCTLDWWGVWDSIKSTVSDFVQSTFINPITSTITTIKNEIASMTSKAWDWIQTTIFKPLIAGAKQTLENIIANGIGIGGPIPVLQNMGHTLVDQTGRCLGYESDGNVKMLPCPSTGNGATVDFRLRGLDSCQDTSFSVFFLEASLRLCNAVLSRSRPFFGVLNLDFMGHTFARLEVHEIDGTKFQLTTFGLGKNGQFCLDKNTFKQGYENWKPVLSAGFPSSLFSMFDLSLDVKYDSAKDETKMQVRFAFAGILKGLANDLTLPLPFGVKPPGGNTPTAPYATGDGILSGACPASMLLQVERAAKKFWLEENKN